MKFLHFLLCHSLFNPLCSDFYDILPPFKLTKTSESSSGCVSVLILLALSATAFHCSLALDCFHLLLQIHSPAFPPCPGVLISKDYINRLPYLLANRFGQWKSRQDLRRREERKVRIVIPLAFSPPGCSLAVVGHLSQTLAALWNLGNPSLLVPILA